MLASLQSVRPQDACTHVNDSPQHQTSQCHANANVKVEGRSAIITGPVNLQGAKVKASDLRAGAALVIAGLMAEGVTEITGVEHIDRGYSGLVEKLSKIGATIWREKMTDEEIEQVKNA